MPWVRTEDDFPIHRKVALLDDACFRLEVEAIHWCARNTTDGRIGADELETVSKRGTRARAARLVQRGLWHDDSQTCDSPTCPASTRPAEPGGWVLHDYFEYQPPKAKVLAERRAAAERTARWRDREKRRNGVSDASRDASVTLPRTRPAPRGGGTDGARAQCPLHRGQPADNCGLCRAEELNPA